MKNASAAEAFSRRVGGVAADLGSVSVCVHRLYIQGDGLHLTAVGHWGQLQDRVEGTLQVRHLICSDTEKFTL